MHDSVMGARLLAPTAAPMTATQARQNQAAYSVLSNVCDNLSEPTAPRWDQSPVFELLADQVDFAIDTRFNDLMLDANAIREPWQRGRPGWCRSPTPGRPCAGSVVDRARPTTSCAPRSTRRAGAGPDTA